MTDKTLKELEELVNNLKQSKDTDKLISEVQNKISLHAYVTVYTGIGKNKIELTDPETVRYATQMLGFSTKDEVRRNEEKLTTFIKTLV